MAVVIATGFTGTTYGLKHGRVCYDWGRDGTATATTAAAGFAAVNALPPRTDSAWKPTAIPATWTLTYPTARDVSFVGIAKHDLATTNATIAIEYLVGSTWAAFPGAGALQPADNTPILLLTAVTVATGVRVRITSAFEPPAISVIMVGTADEWPRPFVWTGQPITEGDRIGFENTLAVTGNWLGRSVVSDGLQFGVEMNHVTEAWRQTNLKAFKAYANGEDAAFFIAHRPLDYPNELSYAWATDVVTANRSTPNKAISTAVAMRCQGLRQRQGVRFSLAALFAGGSLGWWHDPSDLSTLFQDAAGTTPVTAAGQPVGLMGDKSGYGYHVSEAVLSKRPILRTAGGLWWLEFDGINDEMSMTLDANVVLGSPASDPGYFVVAGAEYTTAPDNASPFSRDAFISDSQAYWSMWAQEEDAGVYHWDTAARAAGAVYAVTDAAVFTALRDPTLGADGQIFASVNGTTSAGVAAAPLNASAGSIRYGRQVNSFFDGKFFGAAGVAKRPSATEIALTKSYMAVKTGVGF